MANEDGGSRRGDVASSMRAHINVQMSTQAQRETRAKINK